MGKDKKKGGGGGGGKNKHGPAGKHGGGGGGGKVDERRERQRRRKEERLKEWHDPKWKQEFLRFEAQLKLLGLRIVDMTGDGNCLFRSVCDQMEGSADGHVKTRRDCVGFLRQYSENFAPFLDTEEQSFDEYVQEMAQNGEWGGNAELQAMSLGYRVNIVIHQLDKPRWEIVNWPLTQKTIHLSYHNGEHYSSVRPRDGNKLPAVSEATASDFAATKTNNNNNNNDNNKDVEIPTGISSEVSLVMAATDCGDVEMVKQTLVENLYDVQAAIDYILLLQETGDSHSMVKESDFDADEVSDAHKRATKWDKEDSPTPSPPPKEHLPVYSNGKGKKGHHNNKNNHNNNNGDEDDPRVLLAKSIVALSSSKKLSNANRQKLNRLRKEAQKRGIDVEELANKGSRPKADAPYSGKMGGAGGADDDDDEREIDRLMERMKDLGTIKI